MSALEQARREGSLDELGAAFLEWLENHGLVWFDTDARLRDELAAVLNIELRYEDEAVS
jgi:hypothetical protein